MEALLAGGPGSDPAHAAAGSGRPPSAPRPQAGPHKRRRLQCPAAAAPSPAAEPPVQSLRLEELGLSLARPDALGLPPTLPVRQLSSQEALEALYASLQPAAQAYYAFFSSELGGIVTDPALMVVPVDDHLVHRGHAVFDTVLLTEGYLYQLDAHLERFLASAERARLPLPYAPEQLRRIILETAAASTRYDGALRYWLGAGRGGFGLSTAECAAPSFYCMAYSGGDPRFPSAEEGWRVCTSSVALKAPQFATLKSTNYLPNALCLGEAEERGCDQGIFVDSEGYVAEGPAMNVGVITREGELVVPPFKRALAGITIQRVLELVELHMAGIPELQGITSISQRPLHLKEAYAAKEVQPVAQWDEVEYANEGGDNAPGKATYAMRSLLMNDMLPEANTGQHTEVPYDTLPLSARWH